MTTWNPIVLKELKYLRQTPVEGCLVQLGPDDNIMEWGVSIFGAPGTIHTGGYFKVIISEFDFLWKFYSTNGDYWDCGKLNKVQLNFWLLAAYTRTTKRRWFVFKRVVSFKIRSNINLLVKLLSFKRKNYSYLEQINFNR